VSTLTRDRIADWPLWWFSRLEVAVERGDYRAAVTAQRELERLGVTVQYRGRTPVRPQEVSNASR
jgi:hypothetical protein